MANDEVSTILGKALRGELSDREMALIGLSDEAQRAVTRLIETSPALEEAILNVVELVYRDGADSVGDWDENTKATDDIQLPPELPVTCTVCGHKHDSSQIVDVKGVALIPGHEYIILTKTSMQKYPREWRMGYLGFTAGMQFSARGPDRTHQGQYGGTQTIGLQMIIYAQEVKRDDAKRHVGQIKYN